MRWDREPWVKLYRREIGSFALLPLYARALAGELLKFADDDGRLFVGQREPWEAIAKVCGATTGDRRLLRAHVPMLLEDGYLVREGDYLVIRNMPEAQGKASGVKAGATSRDRTTTGSEPGTNPERTVNESERTVNESERTDDQSETKSDVSERNDSDLILAGARASERSEEKRREESVGSARDGEPARSAAPPLDLIAFAADLAAEDRASGKSGVGTTVTEQAARGRKPTPEQRATLTKIHAARASAAPRGAPFGEDERWVAERWREARRRKGLPDGEPEPRHVVGLWTKACKRSAEAKTVAGWKPSPREIVAFWIRAYLDEPQTRAGGVADQNYPLALLVARANEGYHLPTRADLRRPADGAAPAEPDAPALPPRLSAKEDAALSQGLLEALAKTGSGGNDDAAPVRRPGSDR